MHHPIITLNLTKANYPAWQAASRLQGSALGLSQALHDPNITALQVLVRTLASFTISILEYIPAKVQRDAIHDNPHLKLHPLLIHMTSKCNIKSPADHEALELKATLTLLFNFDTLDDYFAPHLTNRSLMLSAALSVIAQERKAIKFLIRGLANHRELQFVVTSRAFKPPGTDHELQAMATSA